MNRLKPTLGLALIPSCALVMAGCSHQSPTPAVAAKAPPPRAPEAAPRPALSPAVLADMRANEVGKIPILMYHAIGAKTTFRGQRYDRDGLNVAPDTFRRQLNAMYAAQWYPVNMRDVLTAHLNVPAGKTPVVITFDDARGTQFRYLKDGTIDPECAVGILEAFHKKHPADWPRRASFYVLPQSAWNPVPFWQPGQERKKLNYLVAQGYELADHSTTHHMMTHMTAKMLTWEMAECAKYVKERAPAATMDTMALPGGAAPRNHALWASLMSGQFNGTRYREKCILMAWGGPADPWAARKFDAERVKRIGVSPGYLEKWMSRMRRGGSVPAYVSDGDPDTVAVPRAQVKDVNPARLQGARLVAYGKAAGPAPARPGLKGHAVASVRGV